MIELPLGLQDANYLRAELGGYEPTDLTHACYSLFARSANVLSRLRLLSNFSYPKPDMACDSLYSYKCLPQGQQRYNCTIGNFGFNR